MPQRNMEALLLCHTPEPETAIALAGRLCYSDSDILSLKDAVQGKGESFVKKLISLGHLSPIEHASFTFAAQGVSRALLIAAIVAAVMILGHFYFSLNICLVICSFRVQSAIFRRRLCRTQPVL